MGTQIPEKLKQRGIKFVLLEKQGKKPFQQGWQNKIIEFDNPELIAHLEKDGNYGVMGGGEKKLLILDFDNVKVQELLLPQLPETFTIKTGSGMLHKYFFSDGTESFKAFDEEMNTLMDVQGEGKQVVGASSIHPNGNTYQIIEDKDINFIAHSELKALVMQYDRKPKKEKTIKWEQPKTDNEIDIIEEIKSRVNVKDVLNWFGIDTSKNPTQCPFHSSTGGKCLGFQDEVCHCFHCDSSWNIFSLVMQQESCNYKEALEWLCDKENITDKLLESRKKYVENQKKLQEGDTEALKFQYIQAISGKNKDWDTASEITSNYIKSKNKIYTTKEDERNEIYIYKNGIYLPNGRSEVAEQLRIFLGEYYNKYILDKTMDKIETDTFVNKDEFFSINYKDEIPVQNGILNVVTKQLLPFTPTKIFFNKLPVEYNPNVKACLIDQFLSDVLANENDKLVYYELGGFCLYKEYTFEKAAMFIGGGRNGKGKCLELMKRVIGSENCFSLSLSALEHGNADVSQLHNKMVNLAGDIGYQDLKDTTLFKGLTGRDLITAKRKFKTAITFQNFAKFIFACNDLPMVYDMSKGFWDRWILLDFPYTFEEKETYDKAEDKSKLKLRDERIVEKISTKEELSGLLNKFLEGLERLMNQKKFSSTRGTEEIKTTWIRKANSFMAFALDCLEQDYESMITKKELRKIYVAYCKRHKVQAKNDYVIKKVLQEDYGSSEDRKYINEQQEFCWSGIKWKVGFGGKLN